MTAENYRKALRQLDKAGWTLVNGSYPNSEAEPNAQVEWVGYFERVTSPGNYPERFTLTPKSLGSPEYAKAVEAAR